MTTSFAPCGLVVGHATDVAGATGCTVVRGDRRRSAAPRTCVGRATGTRELALLRSGAPRGSRRRDPAHRRLGVRSRCRGRRDALDGGAVARLRRRRGRRARSCRPRWCSISRRSAASTRVRRRQMAYDACETRDGRAGRGLGRRRHRRDGRQGGGPSGCDEGRIRLRRRRRGRRASFARSPS